ncbi:16S rRNA (cytosine(1402)-N(4))-methyltransferase RsmH [Devosia nitrariae]|uniref:Ribosomal RNA small subunit methyltransferase H n=1 Tax=Devosia nitrariae TaxID=2071872 RepID=A0ABQ5W186_9HYPH|nr:16S rRNA (cytosine(1402)-N(4))-methyltransferase RsmH [Devosia nitrariae]GLQ53491.1 ribosomal RNA small subunit methyltransferase H [Devosia nitrariae]
MGERSEPEISGQTRVHVPVLMDEVLTALAPLAGSRIVDGTFGAGGYSRGLLEAGAEVIAIDRDPSVTPFAEQLVQEFPDRFTFIAGTFSELDTLAADRGAVDGVVLDIGVSSMQLDQAERGFSFMREGPLDMRMSGRGTSAADLVNSLDAETLANLLYAFGEERRSRRIAQFIVAARANAPIATTLELARVIEKAVGRKPGDVHPATRAFQALRIAVNGEFEQLVEGLFSAERLLGEGGRLAVVTFHSLEDRIAKRFFAPEKGGPAQSRHLPQVMREEPRWVGVAKAVKPGPAELARNPRARSSTLRAARRSAAPARPVSFEGLGVPRVRGAA